jgi:lipopolysaccharide/colanic/teichoic acid biosynthesis glycosyltransferase
VIEIYKFRTMFNDQRDEDAERLTRKGDPRITPLGRFLRRTGIDELPQLFNVLKGEMSIVGPRPHALKARSEGKLYGDVVARYAERHKIKPGISGWAQVNGWRGDTDSEEGLRRRVECDIYYMEHWSIAFDILIMFRTLLVIASGRGAC